MTELKVVHEWRDSEGYLHAVDENGYGLNLDLSSGLWVRWNVQVRTVASIELARLAARVQELENALRDEVGDDYVDECERAKAKITRLREALERITEISAKDSGYADYARWQMMLTEARRALKEKP